MPIVSQTEKNIGIGLRIVNGTNPFNSDYVSSDPIHINSCGYNLFDPSIKRVEISRPAGRLDYQLIYIQEGKGDFIIQGKKQVLSAGSLILYTPGTPQVYSFHNSERTISYFIHFTGEWIPELLKTISSDNHMVFSLENGLFFSDCILKIYRELQLHAYNYDLMCASTFVELITTISRSIKTYSVQLEQTDNAFAPALHIMNNQFHKDLSIEEYADLCGMSPYYFVHKFKE